MEPEGLLALGQVRFNEEMIAVISVVLALAGLALPAAIFTTARKWAGNQPDIAGPILGGAVAICLISILSGLIVILAVIGWLPSPSFFN